MTNFLKILHLADSAFPIGGYAYSYGMEFSVKSGLISSFSELDSYLKEFIRQATNFDLAFVKASFESDIHGIADISAWYNAMLLNPALKTGGITLGKNWLKVLKELYEDDVPAWNPSLDSDFPIVYGYSCKKINLDLQSACLLFVFMAIRDQMSAVVRLGTLGPSKAHKMQHDLLSMLCEKIKLEDIPPVNEAYKTAYMVEMAQLSHKNLYTKLFQN